MPGTGTTTGASGRTASAGTGATAGAKASAGSGVTAGASGNEAPDAPSNGGCLRNGTLYGNWLLDG
ncbi:MAG TPA: hypothetical protein VJR89_27460 [Polyangiales bacterium]|nr:hypothetical protein [Polyangiales bacterium]